MLNIHKVSTLLQWFQTTLLAIQYFGKILEKGVTSDKIETAIDDMYSYLTG